MNPIVKRMLCLKKKKITQLEVSVHKEDREQPSWKRESLLLSCLHFTGCAKCVGLILTVWWTPQPQVPILATIGPSARGEWVEPKGMEWNQAGLGVGLGFWSP